MVDALERRARTLNRSAPRDTGSYVLYWMQHSQRAAANPALERAVAWARRCDRPLLVLFVIDPDYPEANARHYAFMLEGLSETAAALAARGAHFSLRLGTPPQVASEFGRKAVVVVTDWGYLRHLRVWRASVATDCGCLMEAVEGDVIVPVEAASTRPETAARTLRPRLLRAVAGYLDLPPRLRLTRTGEGLASRDDVPLSDVPALLERIGCDDSVTPVPSLPGGLQAARRHLAAFLRRGLSGYGDGRADIVERRVSMLSPYLHFGQISPLEIYLRVKRAAVSEGDAEAFLEEMLVRRELAVNFVHHNADYDRWEGLPAWARRTLEAHEGDPRPALYTPRELEDGRTDDPYWNAAMREMRLTGYLHNHLRMYWGKRIIGWMRSPRQAYATTLRLNNRYFLDGRDASSYANVGWLYGLHDRGWPERPVYGTVRVMTPSGLRRKFDVDAYVRWTQTL